MYNRKNIAKSQNNQPEVKKLVDCALCSFGGSKPENYLIDCFNKERNPKGYKILYRKNECEHYKARNT